MARRKKSGIGGSVVLGVVLALAAVDVVENDGRNLRALTGSIGFGLPSIGGTVPPARPAADVPADYMGYYRAAGDTCPNLDWALLAAIGSVETSHGRSQLPGVHSGENYAGAGGPMQFLDATFEGVRDRHPQLGPSRYDPATAVQASAHLLCDNGLAEGREYDAIYSYNHADWYVAKVRAQAAEYRAAA